MTTVEGPAVAGGALHARRWLEENGLPTGREEPWRYAPVDQLRKRLAPASAPQHAGAEVTLAAMDRLAGRHGAVRIVLVDGVHVPGWSDDRLPPGLWCGTRRNLSPSIRERLTTPVSDPPDGFEALNRAASDDVAYLLVTDGTELPEPVHVVHLSTGSRAAHPRVVVDVGAGARLHLVETHVGMPGGGTNASTTIRLAPSATLTAHRVQDEAPDAVHAGRLELHQDEASHAELTVLSRGAHAARLTTEVDLAGPGASCRVTGLAAPRPGSRHDHVITVDHAASRCTSDLADRSVVPEGARTSSTGHVIVRPGTVGTVVHQRTDNLLLHPTAQADSRPWLEIFADDVRADHGSATGRLDEDALFYLRSRGIPRAEARAVLVGAFARAVVDHLHPPSLRTQVAGWFGHEDST
jgi:Fe-S cluster assembly protein SufD